MAEQGFPGIGTNAWQGMFAPAATPKPIVDKIYQSVAAVLSNPQMKEQLSKQMLEVTLSPSPAQSSSWWRRKRAPGAISCAKQRSRSSSGSPRFGETFENRRSRVAAALRTSSSSETSKFRCATGRV